MSPKGPYKPVEEKLTCRVDVKLTPAEMQAFEQLRGQQTRSRYLRMLVLKEIRGARKSRRKPMSVADASVADSA